MTAEDVRRLALSLPEAAEQLHWGKASFRVRNKIFAVIQENGRSIVVKTDADDRQAYTTLDPQTYSVPENFSTMNYMHVRLTRVDPAELRDLLIKGWKLVAPKRVVAEYDRSIAHGDKSTEGD